MKLTDLKNAYPSIPQECHDVLVTAAGSIRDISGGRRRWSFVLAVIFCLLLLLAGAAIALEQYGILSFGRLKAASGNYYMPEGEQLVSVDLAEKTINGMTIKVKEAYFDGRVLELMYAVSASQKTAGDAEKQELEAEAQADALLSKAGIDLQTAHGYITIDGHEVSLRSMDFQVGDLLYEYEYLVDSDLQYDDTATGETKILHPEKTMNIVIATTGNEAEALAFTLPVPDTGKWSLPLPPPVQINGCTVKFTDLHFSPINTFIEYSVQVPAAMVPDETSDDSGLALFDLQGRFCPMGLTDDKGASLGMGKAGGIRESRKLDNGDLWMVYYVEYTALNVYHDTIYLSLEGGVLPIPMHPAAK